MFQGFCEETAEFLWGLAFHNERPWFQEHKDQFERVLKQPFQALGEETAAQMALRFPDSDFRLHVCRIYRDARRLFGRGPYKDHLWFSLKDSEGLLSGAMFWFELGAAEFSYGMGFYDATPSQMERLRQAVLENPGGLTELAERFQTQDHFSLEGPMYKRPKVQAGELLDPWLNRKYWALRHQEPFGPALFEPELVQTLTEHFAQLMPYYEFLKDFAQVDTPDGFRDRDHPADGVENQEVTK